jgi:aspartate-semialdehyde dehydrogenase
MGKNIAIAGVTGAVGQEFLRIIEQRNFPFDSLKMLASSRSAGKKIDFMGKTYTVEELTENSFTGIDIALFSAGGGRSKQFAPAAVKAGAVVIDNSSAYRMDPEVPLVRKSMPMPSPSTKGLSQTRTVRRSSPMFRSIHCTKPIRSNA